MFLVACGGGGGDSTPSASNPAPPGPTELAFYKSGIERAVGVLLLIEKAGKSDARRIPEMIADQVTAHGPTPVCELDCDQHYFQAALPNGQEATVVTGALCLPIVCPQLGPKRQNSKPSVTLD